MPKQLQKCLKLSVNEGSHLFHTFANGVSPSLLRKTLMLKTTRLPFLLPYLFPSLVKQREATEAHTLIVNRIYSPASVLSHLVPPPALRLSQ